MSLSCLCLVTDDLGQEVPAGVGEEVEEPDAGEDAHVVQDEHDDAVPKWLLCDDNLWKII